MIQTAAQADRVSPVAVLPANDHRENMKTGTIVSCKHRSFAFIFNSLGRRTHLCRRRGPWYTATPHHMSIHSFPRCFCSCIQGTDRLSSLCTHQYLYVNWKRMVNWSRYRYDKIFHVWAIVTKDQDIIFFQQKNSITKTNPVNLSHVPRSWIFKVIPLVLSTLILFCNTAD